MNKPPQSRVGVASLLLAVAAVVPLLVALIPRVHAPFLDLVALAMAAVALILGGLGIVTRARRRSFAILGTIVSLAVVSFFLYSLWGALTKS